MNYSIASPFSYQARLPQYHLDRSQFKEFIRFKEEKRKELRRKIKVIKAFVKKSERIKLIAEDIANHFKEIVEPTGIGALIVTIDREAYVLYKNTIDNFLPPNCSEVIMTFNLNDRGVIKDYYEQMVTKYGAKNLKEIHKNN